MTDLLQILRTWTYRGRAIAPVRQMFRRFLGFPVVVAARAMYWVGVAIGWGVEEANDAWDRMP